MSSGFSEAEIKYKLVEKVPKAQDVRRKEKKPIVKVQHRRAEPIGSKCSCILDNELMGGGFVKEFLHP